jgi:Spy/CpxP family protein refolding chaperone
MAVVGLAVGMAACSALPVAAEEKKEPRDAVLVVEWVQDLNLTEEQENKIADIRKEFKPKVQEAAKDLAGVAKEEVEKIEGVLTAEQKEKLKTAKEERKEFRAERLAARLAHLEELDLTDAEVAKIAEIRKEFQPKLAKAMEGLQGILSDDQKKAREQALKDGKKRKEILESLKLTDEQKEKVEAVCKELRTLVHDELTQMRDVLTDSQKEKLDEFKDERKERVRDRKAHMISTLKDLDLTDEQKTKIADIRKEYRPKVHEAGNKLRATVREEVEAILAVIKG